MAFENIIYVNEEKITVKEFTVRDYKNLLKSLIVKNNLDLCIFNNLNNILEKNTKFVTKKLSCLTFIEYFILLLEIRCLSSNATISFKTTYKDKPTVLTIDLNNVIKTLRSIEIENTLKQVTFNNVTTTLKLPTFFELCLIETREIPLYCFIDSITVNTNNSTLQVKNLQVEQKKQIINSLFKKYKFVFLILVVKIN